MINVELEYGRLVHAAWNGYIKPFLYGAAFFAACLAVAWVMIYVISNFLGVILVVLPVYVAWWVGKEFINNYNEIKEMNDSESDTNSEA